MSNRVAAITQHVKNASAAAASSGASSKERKFKYTLDNPIFTTEQREFYEENGYIVIKGLVSMDKLKRYRERFLRLCNDPKERPQSMTVMKDIALAKNGVKDAKGEELVTKVQDFQDDEELFDYCRDPEIVKYVEAFTGPRIVASHTMLINKPSDLGTGTSRHPMHQDMLYFPFRPTDMVVAAWTAMEKINRENGCLVAVPGSHKCGEILEHGYPDWEGGVNAAYVGLMGMTPDVKYVHLIMDPGDTVFFHPLLFHGSGKNVTPNFRKAISCHFVSGDCHFISVKGTIQEELEREIKDLAKLKMHNRGIELSPEDLLSMEMFHVWEMKSRIVQGDQMIRPIPTESSSSSR